MIYKVTKTAAEYRQEAAAQNRRGAESFENCDTDGFLSQWAYGINDRIYTRLAELAENGGKETFTVLADLEGNLLDARPIETKTQWGRQTRWMIYTHPGVKFAPYHPKRPATLAKYGYQEVKAELPACVQTYGESITSVGVRAIPLKWIDPREPQAN